MIRIAVSNPLPPVGSAAATRQSNGLALDNIRERLELAFGKQGALTVDARPDRYTVTIEFPAAGVRRYT